MSRKRIYSFSGILLISFFIWIFSIPDEKEGDFSERVKLSLRDVGHQLLLANQDSTSLVLPIIQLEPNKYQISFESKLAILPDSLMNIVDRSFAKSGLPDTYRVEMVKCSDDEVAHSFEIFSQPENHIIPCLERALTKDCYRINVRFTVSDDRFVMHKPILYISMIGIFGFVAFRIYKRKNDIVLSPDNIESILIGTYQFFPEQNKLIHGGTNIKVSKKEVEILYILVTHKNQIVTREELTKKVWEDHGVIVGRSLDTYISKLRKLLKQDDTINITNIHGVGYRLEVSG